MRRPNLRLFRAKIFAHNTLHASNILSSLVSGAAAGADETWTARTSRFMSDGMHWTEGVMMRTVGRGAAAVVRWKMGRSY